MKYIKRLILLFSLLLLYLIGKEFLLLYSQAQAIHPYWGYAVILLSLLFIGYFVLLPLLRIWRIPRSIAPTDNPAEEAEIIAQRMKKFRQNCYLQKIDFDFSKLTDDKASYEQVVAALGKEADRLRRRDVSQLFYSTSLAQNGFLDAIFILSASINHVKSIFLLYNGRVNNRDLWKITRNIYYSMAIGGSEGVEYATDEIVSKFASDAIKGIPFIDKILASLADGLVNSILLTRISYITENYCRLTYISSRSDLSPSANFVVKSAQNITSDIMEKIYKSLRRIAMDKTLNFAQIAINPVGYVWGRAIENKDSLDAEQKIRRKEQAKIIGNPIAYGFSKLYHALRK
ncbi:MAG: hypothetical protein R6U84_02160 [Candidatus Cloacimonadales bacterium]